MVFVNVKISVQFFSFLSLTLVKIKQENLRQRKEKINKNFSFKSYIKKLYKNIIFIFWIYINIAKTSRK